MKKRILALVLSAVMICSVFTGFAAPTTSTDYGTAARVIVKDLEKLGPRLASTKAEEKSAAYIESFFKKEGITYKKATFNYVIQDEKTKKESKFKSANVIATIVGKQTKQIIIGAHYDSAPDGKGADDNASGVAVMLETASRIAKLKEKPNYTLVFVAFGAEETGLNGSKAYVDKMSATEKKNTVVMINLDSLIAGDDMNIYGDFGKKGVYRDLALGFAKEQGIPLTTNMGSNPKFPLGTTGDWSDHAPFKAVGIPYAYMEGTNWNLGEKDGYTQVDLKYGTQGEIWHTKYDVTSYMEKTFPKRIESHLEGYVKVLDYLLLYK